LFLMGIASAQTFYKWADAHGTTHYSEQKPASAAKIVTLGASPVAVPAVAASQTLPASASVALDEAKSAFRRQACATARSNLALLMSGSMVVDAGTVQKPAGLESATKLSPEQRSAAKATAQEQIDDYCDKR
jgi:hypothetical protein